MLVKTLDNGREVNVAFTDLYLLTEIVSVCGPLTVFEVETLNVVADDLYCVNRISGLFWPAAIYYVNETIGEANRNKGQTFLSAGMCVSTVLSTLIGGSMLSSAGGDPYGMLLSGAAISAVGMIFLTMASAGKGNTIRQKEEVR